MTACAWRELTEAFGDRVWLLTKLSASQPPIRRVIRPTSRDANVYASMSKCIEASQLNPDFVWCVTDSVRCAGDWRQTLHHAVSESTCVSSSLSGKAAAHDADFLATYVEPHSANPGWYHWTAGSITGTGCPPLNARWKCFSPAFRLSHRLLNRLCTAPWTAFEEWHMPTYCMQQPGFTCGNFAKSCLGDVFRHNDPESADSWLARPASNLLFHPVNCVTSRGYAETKQQTKTLEEIGHVCGTDKVTHGFCRVYDIAFASVRTTVRTLMEIGVFFGASVEMWKSYFPHVHVHGVDHFIGRQGNGSSFANPKEYYDRLQTSPDPRITLHTVDQSRDEDVRKWATQFTPGSFDIIVEDGSHMMRDQHRNFALLFSLVKPGGWYVIEDVHCSLVKDGSYGVKADASNTSLTTIRRFERTNAWSSEYFSADEAAFLTRSTGSVQLAVTNYGASMTCLIQRQIDSL